MAHDGHKALVQIEQALNNLQNGMVNDQGELAFEERWFEVFDTVLKKIIETRALADTLHKSPVTATAWDEVAHLLKA